MAPSDTDKDGKSTRYADNNLKPCTLSFSLLKSSKFWTKSLNIYIKNNTVNTLVVNSQLITRHHNAEFSVR